MIYMIYMNNILLISCCGFVDIRLFAFMCSVSITSTQTMWTQERVSLSCTLSSTFIYISTLSKKKCPPVIDAVNDFLLVSPVTCRHWSSDLRAASHVDWVQTWRLWSLDGLQHLRFLNNFRSANSSWRFVCGRSSDFTAAETFDSESCRRHTHWWSGLGTELWFFYGTDRNASIAPSVKICLVFRWQVSTPRG